MLSEPYEKRRHNSLASLQQQMKWIQVECLRRLGRNGVDHGEKNEVKRGGCFLPLTTFGGR